MKKMIEATRLRGLYAITPGGLPGERLIEQVDSALRGGATLVQYRDKQRDSTQQAEIARALRALCRQHGARLIVNDDLQLALAVDADGLHLGGCDGDLAAARKQRVRRERRVRLGRRAIGCAESDVIGAGGDRLARQLEVGVTRGAEQLAGAERTSRCRQIAVAAAQMKSVGVDG